MERIPLYVMLALCLVLAVSVSGDDVADTKLTEAVRHARAVIDSLTSVGEETDETDRKKRAGQILGFGGQCAQYNEKCSFFASHCCGAWKCKYKKWYHRVNRKGGRCL